MAHRGDISPAWQAGDFGGDLVNQLPRVAADAHHLVTACASGNDREVPVRKVPSPGKQPQQRLIGPPGIRR